MRCGDSVHPISLNPLLQAPALLAKVSGCFSLNAITCCNGSSRHHTTDVVIAAFRSKTGASRALLDYALQRKITMVVSVPLLFEYEAILKRNRQQEVHGLADTELDRALQLIAKTCDKQPLHFLWRPQLQDVADEMVLETAINGRVDMLVTFNQRHLHDAAQRFNLRCVRPADCLHELEKLL